MARRLSKAKVEIEKFMQDQQNNLPTCPIPISQNASSPSSPSSLSLKSLGATRRLICIVPPKPSVPKQLQQTVQVAPSNSESTMNTSTPDTSVTNVPALVSPGPYVKIEDHQFKEEEWKRAVAAFRREDKDKASVKAGKSLVSSIFAEEMDQYTKSGRKRKGAEEKTLAVPQDRVDAVLDALKYMERRYNGNSEFEWSPSARELLITKVFTDTFNYNRILKRRKRAMNANVNNGDKD